MRAEHAFASARVAGRVTGPVAGVDYWHTTRNVFGAVRTQPYAGANLLMQALHILCGASLVTVEHIMNIIIWLIVGGVIGWLASMLMKTDNQQGLILNVVVGIAGAMLAGWFISPLVGVGTINQNNFSLSALVVSFLGAAALLAIVNLFRRGSLR